MTNSAHNLLRRMRKAAKSAQSGEAVQRRLDAWMRSGKIIATHRV